ncbi:hypothetical protein DFP72DRAFT_1082969 [Ephemerocybe angulata]|uniref:Uncharacterized protein n=1 Tax=Ephemerocybe angulata TaxID=980116 RepID=A0A8H6LTA2_9AGAR|nr:hypothetical protein DFP72DRAFT_1082969 [Tulosesus angulatus]
MPADPRRPPTARHLLLGRPYPPAPTTRAERARDRHVGFTRRVGLTRQTLLHTNPETRFLEEYQMPVRDVEPRDRLHPSGWNDCRITHDHKNPCCFCALDTGEYTETTVILITNPINTELVGTWAAVCETRNCRYFVPDLERFFNSQTPVRLYVPQPRAPGSPLPRPLRSSPTRSFLPFDRFVSTQIRVIEEASFGDAATTPPRRARAQTLALGSSQETLETLVSLTPPSATARSGARSVSRAESPSPLSRVHARATQERNTLAHARPLSHDLGIPMADPVEPPVTPLPSTDTGCMLTLCGCTHSAGLTLNELRSMLLVCSLCNIVKTIDTFRYHICSHVHRPAGTPREVEVIDLTGESSD